MHGYWFFPLSFGIFYLHINIYFILWVNFPFFKLFLVLAAHALVLKIYSWLCDQGSHRELLEGPYVMLGIKLGFTMRKKVPYLTPLSHVLVFICSIKPVFAFIFINVNVQFLSTICWKWPLLHQIAVAPLSTLSCLYLYRSVSGLMINYIKLFYLFL